MRELHLTELGQISGGRIKDSDRGRLKECTSDMKNAGDKGARLGGRLGGKVGELAGDLLGRAWGIKNSKACQDQERLARQRDSIERDRHAESAYGQRGPDDRRERD